MPSLTKCLDLYFGDKENQHIAEHILNLCVKDNDVTDVLRITPQKAEQVVNYVIENYKFEMEALYKNLMSIPDVYDMTEKDVMIKEGNNIKGRIDNNTATAYDKERYAVISRTLKSGSDKLIALANRPAELQRAINVLEKENKGLRRQLQNSEDRDTAIGFESLITLNTTQINSYKAQLEALENDTGVADGTTFKGEQSVALRDNFGEIYEASSEANKKLLLAEGYTTEQVEEALANDEQFANSIEKPQLVAMTASKPVGMAVERVKAQVGKMLSILKYPPKVTVLGSVKELPVGIMIAMEHNGIDYDMLQGAMGIYWNRQVWIISENIDTMQDVAKTVMHELTHAGLFSFFEREGANGKFTSIRNNYTKLMDTIFAQNSMAIIEKYRKTHEHLDPGTEKGRRALAEEWLCDQTYSAQAKWYDEFIAIIRDIMRIFDKDLMLNDNEIRAVLQNAFDTFKTPKGKMSLITRTDIDEHIMLQAKQDNTQNAETIYGKGYLKDEVNDTVDEVTGENLVEEDGSEIRTPHDWTLTEDQLAAVEEQLTPEEKKFIEEKQKREEYMDASKPVFSMPELVELVYKGTQQYPKIWRYMKNLGYFAPADGSVNIRAGANVATVTARRSLIQMIQTLAHEIGHLHDWMDDQQLKKGGILAKIAAITGYRNKTLAEFLGAPTVVTKKERIYIRSLARETIKREGVLKQGSKEFNQAVSNKYRELLAEEESKRQVFDEKEILEQMIAVSSEMRYWPPAEMDEKYDAYRRKPVELYADTISALLNKPEMLKEKGPTLFRALMNYFGERPIMKQAYDDIVAYMSDPDTLQDNREQFFLRSEQHDKERRANEFQEKAEEERITVSKIWDSLRKMFDTKTLPYIRLVQKWQKEGKEIDPWERIDWWMTRLPYVKSEIAYFLQKSIEVIETAKQNGIESEKLHELMLMQRIINDPKRADDEAPVVSTGGFTKSTAEEYLAGMQRKMEPDKWQLMLKLAQDFRDIYKKQVIDVVSESQLLPPAYLDYMQKNPYYVTFEMMDKNFEKAFGTRTVGAGIYQQYGGVGEIGDVLVATMFKGAALIRAARHNDTKIALLQTLTKEGETVRKARIIFKTKKHGNQILTMKHTTPPPKNMGMISVARHTIRNVATGEKDARGRNIYEEQLVGVVEEYYIDKDLADLWNQTPDKADILMRLGMLTKLIITKLFIQWNPGWILANPVRDFLGTWKKTPFGFFDLLKAYGRTAGEAWASGMNTQMGEREKKLLEWRCIVPDSAIRDSHEKSELVELMEKGYLKDRKDFLGRYYKIWGSLKEQGYDKFLLLPPLSRFLTKLGKVGERWGKFAGDEVMQMAQQKSGETFPVEYQANMIITRFGTPNSFAEGMATKWAEIFFPFSRIAIQDMFSGLEAYKENRMVYFLKTAIINIMPKVLIFAMMAGGMGDELKDKSRKITSYFRRMYNVLPIPFADVGGQTLFLKVPQDYTGQAIGAIFDSMIAGNFSGALGVAGAVASYQPFNLNPFITTVFDWMKYYTTGEVPINFYGSPVIPERVAEAGGTEALKYMSKATFNDFLGGMLFKFPTENVERIEPISKKLLGTFPINALGRFIGITDSGLLERDRDVVRDVQSEDAKRLLKIRSDVISIINKSEKNITRQDLLKYYMGAVKNKEIDPKAQSFKEFSNIWYNIGLKKEGSTYLASYLNARTTMQKVALLNSWEKSVPKNKYNEILQELQQNRLVTKSVYQKKYLTDMEEENQDRKTLLQRYIIDSYFKGLRRGEEEDE